MKVLVMGLDVPQLNKAGDRLIGLGGTTKQPKKNPSYRGTIDTGVCGTGGK
jgi:hypothetical protein